MIIVLKKHSTDEDVKQVEDKVMEMGYEPHTIRGEVRTVVAAVGDETALGNLESLKALSAVDNVMPVQKKFKLISRESHPEGNIVRIGDLEIGNGTFHVVAGPCSVESEEQILDTATQIRDLGASMLRGGAYKPRTSPYDFQGLGEEGLDLLGLAKNRTGLPVVTEILRESDIPKVAAVADVLQIGARNAMNYALLEAVAQTGKPVLLKRGLAATVQEWLLAAEYIAKQGHLQIILCERGIRTYENATRNTLDLSAVAIAKRETCLPVFVDPSHAAGRLDLIEDLSRASVAVGADGLLVEVHNNPDVALSDAAQQLRPEAFADLLKSIEPLIEVMGKKAYQVPELAPA
ncbi:MAG: 3-deoxy-7-phosphoheptulonate synthase [Verrucomicrobiota bacterium]